jgi:hypothetical protein
MNTEPKIGQAVRVIGNSNNHDYTMGSVVLVERVDTDDSTLIAVSPQDRVAHGYLRWADVEAIGLGWEYCRSVLPPEVAQLLAACRGVEGLALRREVKEAIVMSLPDLRDRLAAVMSAREA